MKKYKVEITETETFVIDVLADDEEEAEELAKDALDRFSAEGTKHYSSKTGGPEEEVSGIYDVTDTDDSFSPVNEAA